MSDLLFFEIPQLFWPKLRDRSGRQRDGEDEKDERWVEQLVNEHRVANAVDHPSMRGTHSVIYHPNKKNATDVGLLLQYVDGEDLQEWQKNTNPSMDELLRVFIEVSDGLNQMHLAGYAHADMKPLNVLIDNRTKDPLIIDLGQACPLMTRLSGGGAGRSITGASRVCACSSLCAWSTVTK